MSRKSKERKHVETIDDGTDTRVSVSDKKRKHGSRKPIRPWAVSFLFKSLWFLVFAFVSVSLVFYTASSVIPGVGETLLGNSGLAYAEEEISLIVWFYVFMLPLLFIVLVLLVGEFKLFSFLWKAGWARAAAAGDKANAYLDESARKRLAGR